MPTADIHAIASLGDAELPYTLRRTGRRKTIALTIDAEAGVIVSAPRRAPRAEIDALVRRKRRWIEEKLRLVKNAAERYRPRTFQDGEPCLYQGRRYPLRVRDQAAGAGSGPPVRLIGGALEVQLPPGLEPAARKDAARAELEAWYRARAKEQIPERVTAWHRHFTASPPRVIVKDQRRRWGSCDARGTLRLNWRLIQAPLELVDYVVVHELAHIAHQGHQPGFWAAVAGAMPDFGHRRAALRQLEAALMW